MQKRKRESEDTITAGEKKGKSSKASAPSVKEGKNKVEEKKKTQKKKKVEVEEDEISDDDEEEGDDTLVPLSTSNGMTFHDEDEDDDGEDEGAEETKDGDIVDVDFQFVDPKEIHFHSVKRLLNSYLPALPVSDMVNTILNQVSVGTMIQINDDVDVYGFATVLPIHHYKSKESISFISNYIISNAPDKETKSQLESVLKSSTVGMLIHERMVNMPPQIASPLFDALVQDIQWSKENESDDKLRKSMNFKTYVLIAPCDLTGGGGGEEGKESKKKKQKTSTVAVSNNDMYFHRFEDEVFKSVATMCFPIKIGQSEADIAKGNPQQYRAVMVLPENALLEAVRMIKDMLG